jgi:TrpR-related protein YerC/YecD
MGKVDYYSLPSSTRKEMMNDFYDAIANIESREEAKNFFTELITLSEFVILSRRLQIAKRLLQGKKHLEIVEELHVGLTTVGMVDRWLNTGLEGYRNAIKMAKEKKGSDDIEIDDFPAHFYDIERRFPGHYWLFTKIFGK